MCSLPEEFNSNPMHTAVQTADECRISNYRTRIHVERSIGGRTQSIIGRGYKELELSQVIPADRPYVGLLVIKIFPAYLLPGRSEALTKTTSEDA